MRKYFIPQTYTKVNNAGVKPSTDFEDVLLSINFKPLGFHIRYTPNSYVSKLINIISSFFSLMFMPKRSILCLQYPAQENIEKLFWKAKKNNFST